MRPLSLLALAMLLPLGLGCTLVPKTAHQPQFHNPWPQLRKVAIGPFYNLSENPTVDQDEFAHSYFAELQQIPGFEVVPIGITRRAMQMHGIAGTSGADFQRLAQLMKVDAIVVGSINEYSPYYPPRMAMTVDWYSANPCFHPMPNGYGLPWGRAEEEFIPDSIVEATEFDLATAQLKTQTPVPPPNVPPRNVPPPNVNAPTVPTTLDPSVAKRRAVGRLASNAQDLGSGTRDAPAVPSVPAEELAPGVVVERPLPTNSSTDGTPTPALMSPLASQQMQPPWPDPSGLIPDAPQPICDACRPSTEPILTHTRSYNGHDSDFTEALASYYEFRDEARFGGWQAYLQRSEDFIRFCCHMHVTEMIASRGGARETKVVHRWPFGRYDR